MEGILREPDLAEIERLFSRSFHPENQVIYFPVRHHSPACALHLRRTIESFAPELILIEGPSDSAQLLPHIANSDSIPPFCIYYSYDDKEGKVSEEREKYRAYYPFLSYSPELVAIREAGKRSLPVRFIDLPYALRLINQVEAREEDTRFYYNENKEYEINNYTAMIAARSGCRSFAEFWESRYELGADKIETSTFVRNLFYLGYLMRQATPEEDASCRENSLRETYMATEIRKALSSHKRILVVAGAFHIQGLMEALGKEEKLPPMTCDPENVASYLMPYTFREADSKNGYAAGMPFPAFYQTVWEKMEKGDKEAFPSSILDYIIKTAHYARKTQSISLPDEINALNMTRSLAVLRGKSTAGVYELLDGIRSCFIKGDANSTATFEVDFLLRLLSGMGAGKIVANDCIPPVVREFRALCAQYRLKTSTVERQEITLDIIKNPAHYRKSRFLHQLLFLETEFCQLQSGPDYINRKDKNLVRETWICRYSTQVETRLIDLSVYGTTLSQVCASLIERDFKDNMTAEGLGQLLISVQVMGVDNFYQLYEDPIRRILENEKNFINLCRFIGSAYYLSHMQRLMDGNVHPLIPGLARVAFKEAVGLISLVRQVKEEEEQEICEQMRNLYNLTLETDFGFDTSAFLEAVHQVSLDSFSNSRFFGVCLAISYKEGEIRQEVFHDRISAYLASSIGQPEQAASFICGLFLVARDVLFTDHRILEAIERVITDAENEQFLSILPNLRYAFTCFLPSELGRLGQTIAERHQVSEQALSGSLMASEEEIMLGMRLDTLAADALNKWRL